VGLSGSTYLYALATISVTFVGFSALLLVFRQATAGPMAAYESYFMLTFIQPGEPLAAARAAEADRQLVVDESAAAADEDGWPARETRPILLADAGGKAPHATTVRGDRAAAYDTVGAGGIAAPLLLPVERPGPEVGVVSEKSAVSAAVPSLEGLRMAQTGFRGAAGEGSGGKERTGFHRGRNASAKWKSQLSYITVAERSARR